jgi:hypothetical protein
MNLSTALTSELADELLSRQDGRSELARRQAEQRKSYKPKVYRPCPHCGNPFGYRDLQAHLRDCHKPRERSNAFRVPQE